MKQDIHPKNYRQVIFVDTGSQEKFLLKSTVETTETGKWEDGKEYPLTYVEVSSASHPFYTGKKTLVDASGRVERFKAKMAKSQGMKDTKKSKAGK